MADLPQVVDARAQASPPVAAADQRDWHMLDQLPSPGYVPDNLDPTTKIYRLYSEEYPVDMNTGDSLVGDFAQYRMYEIGERAEDGTIRYYDTEIDTEWTYTSREGSQHDTIQREVAQWAGQLFGRPIDVQHNGAGDWELGLPPYVSGDDRERVDGYDDEVDALKRSFEFELCEACGGDLEDHTFVPDPLGHAHVLCHSELNGDSDELSPDAARWSPALASPEPEPQTGHLAAKPVGMEHVDSHNRPQPERNTVSTSNPQTQCSFTVGNAADPHASMPCGNPVAAGKKYCGYHESVLPPIVVRANESTPGNTPNRKESNTMSTPNPTGEATNLTAAIKFCEASASTARDGVGHVETHSASMSSAGVSGEPLRLAANAIELLDRLAATFDELTAELRRHTTVAEAFRTVGEDAGEKQFNQLT